MEWSQVLTIVGSNILLLFGLFWSMFSVTNSWRKEAKDDYVRVEARTEALIISIRSEIKDFHDRLCAIEERRKCKEGE